MQGGYVLLNPPGWFVSWSVRLLPSAKPSWTRPA